MRTLMCCWCIYTLLIKTFNLQKQLPIGFRLKKNGIKMIVNFSGKHLQWCCALKQNSSLSGSLALLVAPWCSGYHYCTSSFKKVWTQVLHRFKTCSQHARDLQWWGSLKMVSAGNKAIRLSLVNPTAKTIHPPHHQQF